MRRCWFALYAAVAADVGEVFLADASTGFARPLPAVGLVLTFALGLVLFGVALEGIDAGVAYGLLGLSTALVATISILVLHEPSSPLKVVALVTIVTGALLLRSTAGTGARARA